MAFLHVFGNIFGIARILCAKIAEKYNSFFMKVPDGQQFEKTTQPGGNKCL